MNDEGKPKGFGFVDFATPQMAQAALELTGKSLEGREVNVCLSTKKEKTDAPATPVTEKPVVKVEAEAPVSARKEKPSGSTFTAFVGSLSYKTDEEMIRTAFQGCGTIKKIRVAMDHATGKHNGFAHIDFETEAALEEAFKLSGSLIDGRAIRVAADVKKVKKDIQTAVAVENVTTAPKSEVNVVAKQDIPASNKSVVAKVESSDDESSSSDEEPVQVKPTPKKAVVVVKADYPVEVSTPKSFAKCFNCNEVGHMSNECTKPKNVSSKTCHKCGKEGHKSFQCQHLANAAIAAGGRSRNQ